MINLIPSQGRKKRVNDFYFRLVAVFFVAIGSCILIACISLLPSYFLSSINKNLVTKNLETQKNISSSVSQQSFLSTMQDLDKKLSMIESAEKNKYLVSQKVINEIILQKASSIKISRIDYGVSVKEDKEDKKISVYGVSTSRSRLLYFSRALKDSGAFQQVDLPISNFIKDSNIEFSLNLIPS